MIDFNRLRKLSKDYLIARNNFLKVANATELLNGNDNIMGRIGEFIALQFLEYHGRNPRKNICTSNKGFDIECGDGSLVSVKMITSENKTKRTSRIKEPWSELIVIKLNNLFEVDHLGILTKDQFKKALNENKNWGKRPYCKLSMLNPNGLIGKYGVIYNKESLRDMNVFL